MLVTYTNQDSQHYLNRRPRIMTSVPPATGPIVGSIDVQAYAGPMTGEMFSCSINAVFVEGQHIKELDSIYRSLLVPYKMAS